MLLFKTIMLYNNNHNNNRNTGWIWWNATGHRRARLHYSVVFIAVKTLSTWHIIVGGWRRVKYGVKSAHSRSLTRASGWFLAPERVSMKLNPWMRRRSSTLIESANWSQKRLRWPHWKWIGRDQRSAIRRCGPKVASDGLGNHRTTFDVCRVRLIWIWDTNWLFYLPNSV